MRQIKIFQGNGSDKIEQLVNEWLSDPRNPEPIEIHYTYHNGFAGVMIVFEAKS